MNVRAPDKLVYMANQIAAFFAVQPGDAAAQRVADHLVSFWAPSMRNAIAAHLDAGGQGLSPLARAGVERMATRSVARVERDLARAGQPSPGRDVGDDAG